MTTYPYYGLEPPALLFSQPQKLLAKAQVNLLSPAAEHSRFVSRLDTERVTATVTSSLATSHRNLRSWLTKKARITTTTVGTVRCIINRSGCLSEITALAGRHRGCQLTPRGCQTAEQNERTTTQTTRTLTRSGGHPKDEQQRPLTAIKRSQARLVILLKGLKKKAKG